MREHGANAIRTNYRQSAPSPSFGLRLRNQNDAREFSPAGACLSFELPRTSHAKRARVFATRLLPEHGREKPTHESMHGFGAGPGIPQKFF